MTDSKESAPGPIIRVAVINYTGDRSNWGCQATSRELLGLLGRCVPEDATMEPVIVPLLGRRRAEKLVARFMGRLVLRALAAEHPSRLERAALRIACFAGYRKYLPDVRRCDFVAFQAEGTMTGEDYFRGARLLLLPHVAKTAFNIPVISINQTVYSAVAAFEPIVEAAYRRHDQIFVRESASLHFLHGLGLQEAKLLPDTAFLTRPSSEAPRSLVEPTPEGPYFCVSGSALFIKNPFAFERMGQLINHVHLQWKLAPVMLVSTSGDRKFLEFLDQWPNRQFPIHRVPLERSHQQVTRLLSGAEILISGRYHMSILAAVGATPMLMLGTNTFKHQGLTELLAYPMPVREYSEMDAIRTDVAHVLENREKLSEHLAARTREILELIKLGADELRATMVSAKSPPSGSGGRTGGSQSHPAGG